MSRDFHTETIRCPDCGLIQDAIVEHTIPFYSYVHTCTFCGYTVMESDWEKVQEEPKKETP
jgi:uncharacterized protein (DUF2225 family)